MKIYSMTATFGKLEHQTLTLNPGLNVISAANEWGKSTWCAFLVAMLYGLETRSKSTRTLLADKEHYAPWSGKPMSGRIVLNWNGRDITIERRTRGRAPMGEFRAYETATGLDVPELTADNCGQQLLGVERSVFVRSGYIRQNNLNVTDDEALRRRLNNLVTTGDENSSADRLAKGLKELKNKVRYNRTGLLPQAEAELDRLEDALRETEALEVRAETVQRQLDEIEDWRMALENHKDAMAYIASVENERKVTGAERARNEARAAWENIRELCKPLPDRGTAEELLTEIDRLDTNRKQFKAQLDELAPPMSRDEEPKCFAGMTPEQANARVTRDVGRYAKLNNKNSIYLILGIVLLLAGAVVSLWELLVGIALAGVGVILLLAQLAVSKSRETQKRELEHFYGSRIPEDWMKKAQKFALDVSHRSRSNEEYERERNELQTQLKALNNSIIQATQNQPLDKCRADWQEVLDSWDRYDTAARNLAKAEEHLRILRSMYKSVQPPAFPDRLTFSEQETQSMLSDCYAERRHLENLLGQYQGRKSTGESRETLQRKLEAARARVKKLEKTYDALTIAQTTLSDATAELQRKFAPRISRRAGELMSRMTGGRYDKLSLGEDLTVRMGTDQEETLYEVLWRSDGTVDQLYLALRLAVAEALLPEAPLILDDALIRFDDTRLKAAMDILKDASQDKQVILFTCHSREKQIN